MIRSLNGAWSDFGLGVALSISCFPSAVIVPSFQHTSLAQFFDHNDVYLGCMECNSNDCWKLQDEELDAACTIRNVFISQGAEIRDNVTSTGSDHNYDGEDFQLHIIGYRLRAIGDDFELEFINAATLKDFHPMQKSAVGKLIDCFMNIAKVIRSLF